MHPYPHKSVHLHSSTHHPSTPIHVHVHPHTHLYVHSYYVIVLPCSLYAHKQGVTGIHHTIILFSVQGGGGSEPGATASTLKGIKTQEDIRGTGLLGDYHQWESTLEACTPHDLCKEQWHAYDIIDMHLQHYCNGCILSFSSYLISTSILSNLSAHLISLPYLWLWLSQ